MTKRRRREARRNHNFPTRTHGRSRGDMQLCWTRQDQLETRAWKHQIPTISSRCRLLYSTPLVSGWVQGVCQAPESARGLSLFSSASLTLSVIALEILLSAHFPYMEGSF